MWVISESNAKLGIMTASATGIQRKVCCEVINSYQMEKTGLGSGYVK